jgi:hypothetical protein
MLPCCHSLIPGVINPHGFTNDPMIRLDAMDCQNRRIVHGEVDKRHWPAVSLQRAGKYQRPTWQLSQGQKGLDKRAIMASQWPSHPW